MSYSCPTISELQTDDCKIVVDRAISLQYDEYLDIDYVNWVQMVIDEVRDEFPYLRKVSEQRKVVLEQLANSSLPFSIKLYIEREIPDNIGLIDRLLERLREPSSEYRPQPVEFVRRRNWQIFPSTKDADLKSEKVMPKVDKSAVPGIDLSKVPAKFEFMLTSAFKDQAKEFRASVDHIQSNSNPDWIRKFYVDTLHDRWSHIARADIAMDGMISKVMSKVASDPRGVPSWWRSFAISLSQGNGAAAYDTCQRFIGDQA